MAFKDFIKKTITQKPANLKKPHFYKVDSDAVRQLEQLQAMHKHAPDAVKAKIEQDMRLLAYGIAGEEQVAFELNNSYLPIIVLHDLYIAHDDLSAQIDYLIITNKLCLIVECKNLYGNIEVNSSGDFIRSLEYKGRVKKEGIYSPITQNRRHLEMIKKIRLASKSNLITKTLAEKFFDDNCKTVVVLANPKTVINMKYTKKEVKEQIIRCDQLIEHIKKMMKDSEVATSSEKQMFELADFFLSLHADNPVDYTLKYRAESSPTENPVPAASNIADTPLYQELKQSRLEMSRAEGIKAYYVYNNAQIEELITVMPELLLRCRRSPVSGKSNARNTDLISWPSSLNTVLEQAARLDLS